MYICKLCSREFKNLTQLVSHLTHPKSSCKINIKDYYDKFLRKSNEGICIFCRSETHFSSLSKGYPSNVCSKCKNKNPETIEKQKEKRKKKFEERRRKKGYYNLPEICELCKLMNKEVRFKNKAGLARHVNNFHKITPQEYYNKFLKQDGENICPYTGKKTKFKNINEGYFKYYGKGTCSKDPGVKTKKEKTLQKNYGVTNPVFANSKQRIEHFKDHYKKLRTLNRKRKELISLLRKLTIDKTDRYQCQICGRKYETISGLTLHLRKHNISIKEYYDMFWKLPEEGICPISKLKTNFDSFERGYFKYHKSIIIHTLEIKQGAKKSRIKYIKKKILETEDMLGVTFLDLDNLQHIGDLTNVKCNICGKNFNTRYTYLLSGFGKCKFCNPTLNKRGFSNGEKELREYIKRIINNKYKIYYNITGVISNPNTKRQLELDIYIPDLKIAIEYNGLYWHSELILDKPESYHSMKYTECKKKGIQLYQVFEDEWIYKYNIVKEMIKHKLNYNNGKKIYARKCKINLIDSKVKKDFLNANHIQGNDSSKICLGAYYNNELVSVMTFSKGNISRGGNPNDMGTYELSRFANKRGFIIIGSAGKLLSFFKKNYYWKKIYTYADLRWSSGNLYTVLGFSKIHRILPNYFYVNKDRRIHRFSLRKRPDEPENIPEWRLRLEEGYFRIWDAGKLKFELINS